MITAQRLARRLCTCKEPLDIDEDGLVAVGYGDADLDGSWRPFKPVGCERCGGSGYKGRGAIMEVLPVSDRVRAEIVRGSASSIIRDVAVDEGMVTLKRVGMLKVRAGLTSLHAALEVTGSE